jgi:hypothetical protein
MMSLARVRRLGASIPLVLALSARARAADPDPTYAALRAAKADGKAIAVRDFTLERDAFRLRFESGVLQLLTSVAGRPWGAVFSGRGSLELRPATESERRYVAFLAGEKTLEVLSDTFTSALLVFSDNAAAEIEKAGPPAPSPASDATDALQTLSKKQRRDWHTNLQLRVLADALRTERPGRLFVATFVGRKRGPSLAVYDPEGLEWLFAGAGSETSALAILDDSAPRLWYCSRPRVDSGAAPSAPSRSANALHYTVDTTIRRNTEIEGTTTIRWEALADGTRVLPLQLLDKLRIREASLASGDSETLTPVPFIQEPEKDDADAAVVLPTGIARGRVYRLKISYAGKDVLKDAGDGNFLVGARESWYPNLGVFGLPASFDLTYHCPKAYEVVSVGTRDEDRVEGDVRVFRFRQVRPIRVAGFNYGRFEKLEKVDPDSGFGISVYTNRGTPDFIQELNLALQNHRGAGLSHIPVDKGGFADSAMVDGINMARVGSVFYGPLPEKRVAITQQTQPFFGQSWPALVYMPFIGALDGTVRQELGLAGAASFVDEVGPHEMAHQWWGHLVGWSGYRDQWLSEGFAEFSVSLVLQAVDVRRFNPFWERARRIVLGRPRGSEVTNDVAGPITLGWRLSTRRSPDGYAAIVYSKGAYVLHMLRMAMIEHGKPNPDARFIEMMKDFVATWTDRNPSTRDFQAVVERHMVPALDLAGDGKMNWFFRQWVEGTEIPGFETKLDVKHVSGDQYQIRGSITQSAVPYDFMSLAHLYVELPKGEVAHLGSVRITGSTTLPIDTTVRLAREPRRLVLNAMHDVLSRD